LDQPINPSIRQAVGDGKTPLPHLASNPGLLLAPKDFTPAMLRPLAKNDYDWHPERSTKGGRSRWS
jgi:hypothetical protein